MKSAAAPLGLKPKDWVHSTGKRALALANARKLAGIPARLQAAGELLAKRRPELFAELGLGPSLEYLSAGPWPARLRGSPSLQGWIAICEEEAAGAAADSPRRAAWRRMLLCQLHGFAAGLSFERKNPLQFSTVVDHRGHVHLHGSGAYFDLGRGAALKPAVIRPAGAKRVREPELLPGIISTDCDPLLTPELARAPGPKEHLVAAFTPKRFARYVAVLRKGIAEIEAVDPLQAKELCDGIKAVVPLERKDREAHVSSTYNHMRGAIFLCHDEDPVLQGETLVHEFSHDKLNALLELAPVFRRGEAEARYFSPWRPDPRTLRGILLGAHAFLNVARYLGRVARRKAGPRVRRRIQTDSAMRCLQVDAALSAVETHGEPTPLGAELCRELRASLSRVVAGLPPQPGGIWGAAAEPVQAHAAKFRSTRDWLHKNAA
jgi:HEXXH motif-containing protein